jgi:hypothetical protein
MGVCKNRGRAPLPVHVHIGPSPLAKALLLPLSRKAGFAVCVVGRPGGEPLPLDAAGHPTYRLKWEGQDAREEQRTVDWYCEAESVAELPAEVGNALGKRSAVLITATLRDGIRERRRLIEEMLRQRPQGAETIVMPCENSVPGDWQAVRSLCDELGATYLQPLVNRIALPLEPHGPDSRTTRTHNLGEWLVAPPQRKSRILEALAVNDEFDVVEDLEVRMQRKLFMVNGAHLALGIRGALLGRRSLRATAQMPSSIYDVANLHFAMNQGLTFSGCKLTDTFEYGREHVGAYCEVADDVNRIMRKLRRADIAPFLKDVHDRLSAPAEMTALAQREVDPAHETSDWLDPYRDVFDGLELLLARLDAYSDGKVSARRREPLLLDPDIDARVIAEYERCLLDWERASERRERLRKLEESLRAHRIVLGMEP